jgi:hypothetical protein
VQLLLPVQFEQLAQLPGDWLYSPFFTGELNEASFEPKGFLILDMVVSP